MDDKIENLHMATVTSLEENDLKTNLDYIRSLSLIDIAPLLIKICAKEEIDYDWDEEPFVRGIAEYYETSDRESFSIYEEALRHEIWWLNQNYKENTK